MNAEAAEKLVQAALTGVRQITEGYADDDGGRCAAGVLGYRAEKFDEALDAEYALGGPCLCPACGSELSCERALIIHLNDTHEWDFLTIARKLGPDA